MHCYSATPGHHVDLIEPMKEKKTKGYSIHIFTRSCPESETRFS
jgi:hypothetical protein